MPQRRVRRASTEFVIRTQALAVRALCVDASTGSALAALLPIYGVIALKPDGIEIVSADQAGCHIEILRDGTVRWDRHGVPMTLARTIDPCAALFGFDDGRSIALLAADS
jgi:hypothetical protein